MVIAASAVFQEQIARQMKQMGHGWKTVDTMIYENANEQIETILSRCLSDQKSKEIY